MQQELAWGINVDAVQPAHGWSSVDKHRQNRKRKLSVSFFERSSPLCEIILQAV
jgi:hypothetical protein